MASSNTVLRPRWVRAEHSRYLTAPEKRRRSIFERILSKKVCKSKTVNCHYWFLWPWPVLGGTWWGRVSSPSASLWCLCHPSDPAWCPPGWWECWDSDVSPQDTTAETTAASKWHSTDRSFIRGHAKMDKLKIERQKKKNRCRGVLQLAGGFTNQLNRHWIVHIFIGKTTRQLRTCKRFRQTPALRSAAGGRVTRWEEGGSKKRIYLIYSPWRGRFQTRQDSRVKNR